LSEWNHSTEFHPAVASLALSKFPQNDINFVAFVSEENVMRDTQLNELVDDYSKHKRKRTCHLRRIEILTDGA